MLKISLGKPRQLICFTPYTCVNVNTHPRKNVHNEYGQEVIRIDCGYKL